MPQNLLLIFEFKKKHIPMVCFFFFILLAFPHSGYSSEGNYEPISVYLTWQKDPTTTMTVQWITDNRQRSNDLYFQKIGETQWKSMAASSIPMPRKHPFLLHSLEITGLEPNASYNFRVGSRTATVYKFRTMPRDLNTPIRFVVGGDMYHDHMESLIKTHKQAARSDPHFALLGGDLAYGGTKKPNENQKEEVKRWLKWIQTWKEYMVTPGGYLIPFLPCIGNHDVDGRFNQPKSNAPYFYSLFRFPGIQGYNVMDFAQYLSIIILDSSHTTPIAGAQTDWLKKTLQEREKIPNKFAMYHVPAYPSVRDFEAEISRLERENWVPLFEKYFLNATFENHDHSYKRTHPILQNQVNPLGVVYMGDGAWGVKNPRPPKRPDQAWYIAHSKKQQHFILVTMDDKERNFKAIKPDGQVFDSYTQKITELPSGSILPSINRQKVPSVENTDSVYDKF